MGHRQFSIFPAVLFYEAGQSKIDTVEGDLIDQNQKIGNALSIGGKDKRAESLRDTDKTMKGGGGYHDSRYIGFGNALGGIGIPGHQTGGGENTSLSIFNPVENDFPTVFRVDLNPYTPTNDQQVILARLTGGKNG